MGSELMPSISVVIPVYRRIEWIPLCLEALRNQNSATLFEVIIVDDGSPNRQQIEDLVTGLVGNGWNRVFFFRKSNGGPASARNYGFRESRGDIICFIDDDSIVGQNWINEIANTFADMSVSVVSGKILSYNRENPFPLLLEKSIYTGVHWATCNIAYRRELFERLGGFDERFKEASWEDNDLGLRARWASARQMHNDKAVVFHSHEETIAEYLSKCLANGRGAAAFSRKYLSQKTLWALVTPVIMSRYLALFLCPSVIARNMSASYLKFLWSLYSLRGFWGAITGNASGTNQKG